MFFPQDLCGQNLYPRSQPYVQTIPHFTLLWELRYAFNHDVLLLITLPSLLKIRISVTTLFSDLCNQRSSVNVGDHILHFYNKTCIVIWLYILKFYILLIRRHFYNLNSIVTNIFKIYTVLLQRVIVAGSNDLLCFMFLSAIQTLRYLYVMLRLCNFPSLLVTPCTTRFDIK
jgi:hypothetical protein